jgi:exopolyphosphatase/guanosine-5'-triphosphate,3'-diphosphate pyrophosphatase
MRISDMHVRSAAGGTTPVAAIDIGSNSIHLIIARMDKAGQLEILDTEKISVRLGQFLQADGHMSPEGQRRALKTLTHMAKIASAYGAMVRAVATHSFREASNHQALMDEIQAKTGIKIELIDGVEEARLVYLGMRYALPIEHIPCLGMDIGGGSTEIIVARGEQIKFVTSVKLGAVTLTSKHFGAQNVTATAIKKLHEYINLRIEPLGRSVSHNSFKRAIASSGTAKAIAVMHSRIFRKRELLDENGYKLPAKDVRALVGAMERLRSPKRIREVFGVDPARADIILAGAAIMEEVARVFRVKEWTITSFGLREGVIVDSFRRMAGERVGRSRDIRWESVRQLAEQWQVDLEQAEAVTNLAVEIFDKLAGYLHPEQNDKSEWLADRDLLRVAALLHESGKFISQSSYHRHSYYLINHGRIMGFTQDERHLIALVALHHRKAMPKFDQGELKGLHKPEFKRVEFLAGILRLAVALSRSRKRSVKGVTLRRKPEPRLRIRLRDGADGLVEMQQVEREQDALERAMGWHLAIDADSMSIRAIKKKSRKKKVVRKKRSTTKFAERLIKTSRRRATKKK